MKNYNTPCQEREELEVEVSLPNKHQWLSANRVVSIFINAWSAIIRH